MRVSTGTRKYSVQMKNRQDAKKLPNEDQRKLINSAPLTVEYFRYSMDTLLVDCSAAGNLPENIEETKVFLAVR